MPSKKRPLGTSVEAQSRNPDWVRDELILALDLYCRSGRRVLPKTHPEVVALSELLRRLDFHRGGDSKFRNANGVAMKLANLRRSDPRADSKGLAGGNGLEPVLWRLFDNDPETLRRIASAIESNGSSFDSAEDDTDHDAIEFPEGRVLYRSHRMRERSGRAVELCKRLAGDRPRCDVCSFEFLARYGELGRGFIECHHTRPVSELRPGDSTKIKDLALVCSNCHRMLHRRRPWLSVDNLRSLLQTSA